MRRARLTAARKEGGRTAMMETMAMMASVVNAMLQAWKSADLHYKELISCRQDEETELEGAC